MDNHHFPAMLGSGFNTYDVCANVHNSRHVILSYVHSSMQCGIGIGKGQLVRALLWDAGIKSGQTANKQPRNNKLFNKLSTSSSHSTTNS